MSASFWLKLLRVVLPGLAVGALAGFAFWAEHRSRAEQMAKLELQLRLAGDDRNARAVKEVARRLMQLDPTAKRQLQLASVFLSVRAMDEFWLTLKQVEIDSPEMKAAAEHLRARACIALGDLSAGAVSLRKYLGLAVLTVVQKSEAWDELADVQARQERWDDALLSLNTRMALRDTWEGRLARAKAWVRLRRWPEAGDDFSWLMKNAPTCPGVKDLLPRWERVERGLKEMRFFDEAIASEPNTLKPRLKRMLLEARLGLWQNAAEDIAVAVKSSPSSRLPRLLAARLASGGDEFNHFTELKSEKLIEETPWLAPSFAVMQLCARLDGGLRDWQTLLAADLRIDRLPVGWVEPSEYGVLFAGRARLEFELGFHALACADAAEVLVHRPNELTAELVELEGMLAENQLAMAGERLERVLQEHTEVEGVVPTGLLNVAGRVYQARGQHQLAVDAFTKCLAFSPDRELLLARAKSLRLLQRFADAERDQAKADALPASEHEEDMP